MPAAGSKLQVMTAVDVQVQDEAIHGWQAEPACQGASAQPLRKFDATAVPPAHQAGLLSAVSPANILAILQKPGRVCRVQVLPSSLLLTFLYGMPRLCIALMISLT